MTKKKSTKRVVPFRNYVLLLFIFAITGLIFWLLVEPFKEDEKQESEFTDKLEKLDYGSFGEFITERQEIIVYLTDFSEKTDEFEIHLEKIVKEKELTSDVVYVNTKELVGDELLEIKNNYFSDKLKSSKVELNVIPNLLLFEDGKIIDVLYKVETNYLESEIVVFLENYGVLEND